MQGIMKAIVSGDAEQSIGTEDTLRLIVDTTPALIHTGRPDGHLDYFNRGWLVFLGCSLDDVCGWRWTNVIHPDDVAGIRSEMACRFSQRRAFRSGSTRAARGWRIPDVPPSQSADAR